jgi:hypothetical protein
MRLPIGLVAMASLFLLGSAVVASTTIASQASNAAEESIEPSVVLNTSGDADERAGQIAGCMTDTSMHLPGGTDRNLFCSCVVDQARNTDASQRDAVFQCAARMHFSGPAFRASEIRECAGGAPGILPDGADANAFCTCAVDKMLTTTPQFDALHECATTMHLTLRNLE